MFDEPVKNVRNVLSTKDAVGLWDFQPDEIDILEYFTVVKMIV